MTASVAATRKHCRDTEGLAACFDVADDSASSVATAADRRDALAHSGATALQGAEMRDVVMMLLAVAAGMTAASQAGLTMEYLSSRMC